MPEQQGMCIRVATVAEMLITGAGETELKMLLLDRKCYPVTCNHYYTITIQRFEASGHIPYKLANKAPFLREGICFARAI